jgi:hypothetical protein
LVTADHSGYSDFNLLPVTSPNRISETHQFVLTDTVIPKFPNETDEDSYKDPIISNQDSSFPKFIKFDDDGDGDLPYNISDKLIQNNFSSIRNDYNSYTFSYDSDPVVWYIDINSTYCIIHTKPVVGETDTGDESHTKSLASADVGYGNCSQMLGMGCMDNAGINNDAIAVGERVDGCEKSLNEVEEARTSTPFLLENAYENGGNQIQPAIGQSGAGVLPRERPGRGIQRPGRGIHVRGKIPQARKTRDDKDGFQRDRQLG